MLYCFGRADYPPVVMVEIEEMYKQAGILQVVSDGVSQRGTTSHLLVLPNGLSATELALMWITGEHGAELAISLMAQVSPTGGACEKTL